MLIAREERDFSNDITMADSRRIDTKTMLISREEGDCINHVTIGCTKMNLLCQDTKTMLISR